MTDVGTPTDSGTPHRPGGRTPAPLVVATVLYAASALLLLVVAPTTANRLSLVQTIALFGCGALIVRRTATPVIGWLLVVPGVTFNLLYASVAVVDGAPGGLASWLSPLSQLGIISLALLLLVFPSGRLESRLARITAVGAVLGQLVAMGIDVLVIAGVVALPPQAGFDVMLVVFMATVVAGLVDQAMRYRGRPRVEQLQLKWFLVAIAGQLVYAVMALAGIEPGSVTFAVFDNAATTLFPLAILVAITRYRLYEVDRLVSRTVGYGLVVAVLAVVGVGTLALLTTVLPTEDGVATAAATLAVLALFNPLRRRLLAAVDRRFDRTRYVAQQVVEQFGRAVADTTDLDAVRARVHDVVGTALAPATVAVWEPATRPGREA